MINRHFALLFLAFGGVSSEVPRAQAQGLEPLKLKEAFALLEGTKRGSEELKKARAAGVPITLGSVSRTDVTATRVQDAEGERLRTEVKVIVAENKDPVFQALDLVHELVHAGEPKANPFDPKLEPEDYVRSGIEGKGGESQAILAECEVGKEFIESHPARNPLKPESLQLVKARCEYAWKSAEEPSKWIRSFYNLGQFYSDFISRVSQLKISEGEKTRWRNQTGLRSPLYSSAVAHKPYPLALLEEYIEITRKVCDKAKIQNGVSRAIASLASLNDRCQKVGVILSP
jgi:hypothetical protein